MALAVLGAIAFQVGTPHQGRVPYWWIFPVLEFALLCVLIVVDPGTSTIEARGRGVSRSR
jgi:hypothetical protein